LVIATGFAEIPEWLEVAAAIQLSWVTTLHTASTQYHRMERGFRGSSRPERISTDRKEAGTVVDGNVKAY
jgi:hypothetical protein